MVLKFLSSRGQNAHREKLMVFVTPSFTGFTNRCLGFLRIVDAWNSLLLGRELHTMKKINGLEWATNHQIPQWFSGEIHNLTWSKFSPCREGFEHDKKCHAYHSPRKLKKRQWTYERITDLASLIFSPCRETNVHEKKIPLFESSQNHELSHVNAGIWRENGWSIFLPSREGFAHIEKRDEIKSLENHQLSLK